MAPLSAQAFAQEGPKLKKRGEPTAVPQNVDKDGLPPEEDTSIAVPVYGFNPLQAQKEIRTGNYYFKKGSYRAAAGRFEEARRQLGLIKYEGYADLKRKLAEQLAQAETPAATTNAPPSVPKP